MSDLFKDVILTNKDELGFGYRWCIAEVVVSCLGCTCTISQGEVCATAINGHGCGPHVCVACCMNSYFPGQPVPSSPDLKANMTEHKHLGPLEGQPFHIGSGYAGLVDEVIWVKTSDEPYKMFGCTSGKGAEYHPTLTPNSLPKLGVWALAGASDGDGGYVFCQRCAAGILNLYPPGVEDPSMPKIKTPKICLGCKVNLCEVCGVCENTDCKFVGFAITSQVDLISVRHKLANTQKAKGYVALSEVRQIKVPKPFVVVMEDSDIDAVSAKMGTNKPFVRPCPIRPRHGFVESRPVDVGDTDAIRKIFNEAKEADPSAELLIVPKVDAAYNLIVTPTRFAIGPGNDGATAGKGAVTIPLMGVPFKELDGLTLAKAGVNTEEDDPYIEVVIPKGMAIQGSTTDDVQFTQLRAGVKIPPAIGADFVPEQVRVEEVLEASGDLLEWERQARTIKRGTVVCHVGGTLISHYGVHCLYNKIPVFTSRRPDVGEVLTVNAKLPQPDPQAVIGGLGAGALLTLSSSKMSLPQFGCSAAVKALLVANHNAGAMGDQDGFYLGAAAALMLRVGMAASHGEARHAASNTGGLSRSYVYEQSLKDFIGSRNNLHKAQDKFLNYKHWGSGYGGKKWAACTEGIIGLDLACRLLMKDPSESSVKDVIVALNNAINQAHNAGWWLNKFVGQEVFDSASKQSLNIICSAAPVFGGLRVLFDEKRPECEAVVAQWADCPDIVVTGKAKTDPNARGEGNSEDKDIQTDNSGFLYCSICGQEHAVANVDDAYGGECENGCEGGVLVWEHEVKSQDPIWQCTKCKAAWASVPAPGQKCGLLDCDGDTFVELVGVPGYSEMLHLVGDTPTKKKNPFESPVNVGGEVFPNDGAPISAVHARSVDTHNLHFQWRVEGVKGYYSYTLKGSHEEIIGHDYSWSGSGVSSYAPLEVISQAGNIHTVQYKDRQFKIDTTALTVTKVVGEVNEPEKEAENEMAF